MQQAGRRCEQCHPEQEGGFVTAALDHVRDRHDSCSRPRAETGRCDTGSRTAAKQASLAGRGMMRDMVVPSTYGIFR